VKVPKGTKLGKITQYLLFSSSTTRLLTEGLLLPLCRLFEIYINKICQKMALLTDNPQVIAPSQNCSRDQRKSHLQNNTSKSSTEKMTQKRLFRQAIYQRQITTQSHSLTQQFHNNTCIVIKPSWVAIIHRTATRAALHALPSEQYGLWLKCGPIGMRAKSVGQKVVALLCSFGWRGSWVPI